MDPGDPDFVPNGSSFSLSWSPWHFDSESGAASLAYISNNYLGLRRISLHGAWPMGSAPDLRLEELDTASICLALCADAFVEWEEVVGVLTARPGRRQAMPDLAS